MLIHFISLSMGRGFTLVQESAQVAQAPPMLGGGLEV